MTLRNTKWHLWVAALTFGVLLQVPPASAQTVVKSPNDKRDYESFVLPNQLKVVIISDPSTDKAAAALDVFVGSGSNPERWPGLAHFLEHMLFLGTKKYPQANEYQAFISQHGGRHNAYTAYEHTNYFFDVDKDYLEPALDRFAQFFIAPLFTPQYVDRERKAVDSEYQARIKSDGMRVLYAWKAVTNPENPFSHFDIGSLDTLTDHDDRKLRDALIDFYERHYSANIMALVVLGKESLPTLKQWVTEKFGAVKNIGARPLRTSASLFVPGTLPARLNVVSLKDRRGLTLSFPIPPVIEHYRSKPTHYIANLLGHEGKGSLLSLLKGKGWVDTLSAGLGVNNMNNATFDISMSLTKAGMQHIPEIVPYVFQYIELIRNRGIAEWLFDEQRRLAEISFRFQEKRTAFRYASGLASNLQVYPAIEVIRGPYEMEQYDPALIRRYLEKLRPDNALITVNAKGLATNTTEPWFNATYEISHIQTGTIRRWQTAAVDPILAIPKPNIFLPDNL
ncbi:MAG: insulinase family protein, partial [Acidiferrobacterales bacterium]